MERVRAIGSSGDATIAEFNPREGIATSLSYAWSKDVPDASKKRLAGDKE